jgi:hypothetical protein
VQGPTRAHCTWYIASSHRRDSSAVQASPAAAASSPARRTDCTSPRTTSADPSSAVSYIRGEARMKHQQPEVDGQYTDC